MKANRDLEINNNAVFISETEYYMPLLLQAVCAGRNTNGCILYLGWKNKEQKLNFEGLKNPEKFIESTIRLLVDDPSFSFHSFSHEDLKVYEENGRKGFMLTIKEAPRSAKPVTWNGLSYYFSEGEIKEMSPNVLAALRRMVDPYSSDLSEATFIEIKDLQTNAYQSFRSAFLSSHKGYRHETPREFMKVLRLALSDSKAPLASVLFLGSQESLYKFHPGLTFQLENDNTVESAETGAFEGGLYSFYLYAVSAFEKSHGSSSLSEFKAALFQAITHTDFHSSNPLFVQIKKDRAAIYYSGAPFIKSDGFNLFESMHPLISSWFKMVGIGLDAEETSPSFAWDANTGVSSLILSFKVKEAKQKKPIAKAKPKEELGFAKEIEDLFKEGLCRKVALFKSKIKDGMFGRAEFLEATGVSPATGTAMIKKLLKAKKIRPIKGQGKGKYRFR